MHLFRPDRGGRAQALTVLSSLLAGLMVASCAPRTPDTAVALPVAAEAAPADATTGADLEMPEIMIHVVDPAARAFWKGWGSVYTKEGWTDISPKDEAEWKRVEDGAATLVIATNTLLLDRYAREPVTDWNRFAQGLAAVAVEGKNGAEHQDREAMFTIGEKLDEACDACHAVFAPHL